MTPFVSRPQDASYGMIVSSSPFPSCGRGDSKLRTLAVNQSVSLPVSLNRANVPWSTVFTLAWTLLLAQYSGSSVVDLTSHTPNTREHLIQVYASQDHSIDDLLQHLLQERGKEPSDGPASSPSEITPNSPPLSQVSLAMPWSPDKADTVPQPPSHLDLGPDEALRLVVVPGAAGSRYFSHVYYSPAQIHSDVARRVMYQFAHLCRQVILHHSSSTVQQLDTLNRFDQTTLQTWARESFTPVSSCLHRLVAARAREDPAAPAVSAWDGELSYGELITLSHQLRTLLVKKGLQKGDLVPLLFEKSKWMVVSVLAVLQAGGVCVSLCNSHPDSYIQNIVRQTKGRIILCSSSETQRLTAMNHAPWTIPQVLEAQLPLSSHPVTTDGVPSNPQDLAYVIFTSGSTGEPKGVLLTHEAIATSTHYHGCAVNVQSTSCILQFSSYAFDMSVIETWYALARGGCLCIPSEKQRLWSLPAFIRDHRASWAFFTPTMLRNYQPDDLSALDTLVLGGEPVTQDLVQQWQGLVRLFDLWGPAESAGAAGCEILPNHWIPGTFGRGAGCTLWIVRPECADQLAAIGTVGEVIIEGHIVAQGYLGDPVRSQQVFIPPPPWRARFPRPVEGRFFKTGDLARYNPDGTVCYVARKDTMVKINGQRLDLEAVEVAIRTLRPACNVAVDAVRLKNRINREDPVLIAFVESDSGAAWTESYSSSDLPPMRDPPTCTQDATSLHDGLSRCLPRFMVPRFFIPLTGLPVGATGKVDKKRLRRLLADVSHSLLVSWLQEDGPLPSPDILEPKSKLPQCESERLLRDTVGQVLGMPSASINLDTPFRQLGGDSVSAIQVVRVLAERGVTLDLEGILSAGWSLRALASSVQDAKQKLSAIPPPPAFSLVPPSDDVALLLQSAARQCQITASEIEDVYPCTALQEGLLSLTAVVAAEAYIDRFLFHLPSTTTVDRVQVAWQQAIAQTPILRTRIVQSDAGIAYQVVVRTAEPWSKYPTLEAFTSSCSPEMGFGSPLVQLSVIQGPSRMLALTLHHAVYDGWTFSLLLRLVEQLYSDSSSPVDLLPFSFFVHQLQTHQPAVPDAHEFWRHEMADVQPPTFPDYPIADYIPRATTSLRRTIQAPLPLASSSSSTSVSPTARLGLAWAILLSLYSGVDDVVFGNVVDGRHARLPGIERLAGPTISTVPVRMRLRRDHTVWEMFQDLQASILRTLPFEHSGLQTIARAGPDAALACRFRTLLVVQSDPLSFDCPVLGHIEVQRADPQAQGFPGYGLVLICHPAPTGWTLELLADEHVVSTRQASRLLEQLDHVLHQLVREEQALGELDLLCPADQAQLKEWHADIPETRHRCVHDLVSEMVVNGPGRTAVAACDGDLTYLQLEQLSSALSVDLRQRAASPEDSTLCVLLPRSRWVPVAMLASMKAGRPFVMLDLEQSVSHQRKICEKVKPGHILACSETVDRANCLGHSVVLIDTNIQDPRGSQPEPGEKVNPNSIAYIVFTSGTTGEPKGVMIEHHQFASAAIAQQAHLHINRDSRVLHLSSYTFDSFAVEILTTLCAGGCVCIPSADESRHEIARAVQGFQATWVVITPSMLHLLDPDQVPTLRTLVAVGESMLPPQAEQWLSRVQVLCGYGPTECCTGASAHPIHPVHLDVRNIGTGMGARLWLVDRDNPHRLAPIGAIGEIVIQGPIVARGYLHDPSRTRDVFLESADWVSRVSSAPGHRLYKTGDLGRYNEDGSCTFLGRKDQLVKLRGQRVALPVVEHHLHRAFGQGCTAIATLVQPSQVEARPVLVAMVHLPQSLSELDTEDDSPFCRHSAAFTTRLSVARDTMLRELPAVAVPSLFLQLPRLPLLASGKVSRVALQRAASGLTAPELSTLGRVETTGGDDPLDRTEEIAWALSESLASITARHFEVPKDPSSDSGQGQGHSQDRIIGRNVIPVKLLLDSIDMVSFARLILRDFDFKIPTTVLFQSGLTVRRIASMIDAQGKQLSQCLPDTTEPAAWWTDYTRLSSELAQLPTPSRTNNCRDHGVHQHRSGRRIFLTGGTGFLGTRILQQLVSNPVVESVTVLVRAPGSVIPAMARIIQSARLAQWWRDEYRRVIQAWDGDLTRPQLGLSDDHWAMLCGQSPDPLRRFDTIIHNGAMVHWVFDYTTLQPSNVQSTFEILRALSSSPHPTGLTYVSALRPGDAEIQVPLTHTGHPSLHAEVGYSQTKLVSDLLIRQYAAANANCHQALAVIRPGLIMGSAADGVANMDDVTWRTVSAAISVGGYSAENDNAWIYIAPVDWVATVIVREALHGCPRPGGKVNLTVIEDGLPVQEFWRAVTQATAHPLQPMDGQQWLDKIEQSIRAVGQQHPLWPVIDFFQATSGCIGSVWQESVKSEKQVHGSVQSIIWMTVLRNAQYLASLGYWEAITSNKEYEAAMTRSLFRRGVSLPGLT